MKRIPQLDGVRGLAIAAVLINHLFRARLLWMGVDLFFILSGFLITGILLEHKERRFRHYLGGFYSRRARRILPPYVLLLAIATIAVGTWWLHDWYFYLGLMNFIEPADHRTGAAFAALWSLAVEEQFYLFWPFAVYFLSEKRLTRLAVGLIVVPPILRWLCSPLFTTEWAIYMLTPFRMDTLATGALIAILWRRNRAYIERFGHLGLLLSALGIGVLLWFAKLGISTHSNTRIGNTWIYEMTLFTCAGVMLWALSGRGVKPLEWRSLRYLGLISYSLYLIHGLVFFEVERHIENPWLLGSIAGGISILYAMASWHFMEKRILSPRKPRVAVKVA